MPVSSVMIPSPRPATSLSQRFSNAAGPSTSFLAANGEFHGSSKAILRDEAVACAAQTDFDSDSHGPTDPISFEFDKSPGYLADTDRASQALPSIGVQGGWVLDAECSSVESFLQIISSVRLHRMPHRASKWDRIIRVLEGKSSHSPTMCLKC